MNILIVTDYQIYPFKIGASVAQFGTIEYLSKLCNLSLLLSEQQPITEQELSELKELLPNVKIYTTEDSTKSSNRIHKNNNNNYFINLLYLFHNLERKSIDFTKKKLKNIIESKQLQKKLPEEDFADVYTNYNPFYIHSKQYIDAIKTIIIEDHIDIVQLEFIETLNLVTILPSNVKKLFIQHVSFLGKPDKSTLVQIYNAADILMAPSLYEGFGITILEAMACGTPVITSNVSAMPEVAGDAGILVDPTDEQAIADAVYHLQNNPVYYQELVKKGLERIKLFTWEKTAEKVAEVYEKLALE